ncbi:winged helix-turn-helix transcriptional regulator [Candidatus Woesearchaeota archaeon]|nr:winged helix-turn-helix transcriptional regulator [Candidatus Woesearchaeota archaeon]
MNTAFFRALADDTRLQIVGFLMSGPKNAMQITSHVNKSQPNVSLALKELHNAGIILSEPKGRFRIFSLKDKQKIRKILELAR